ncbi:MAG: adenylate/guanylate cyclase domain-containing protein [Spirochaetota bacterium]
MKLVSKLLVIFGLGLALMLGLAAWGFPRIVSSISEVQLTSMARTVGAWLVHDLENQIWTGDEPSFEKAIDKRLEFVQSLGDSTGNYRVNKVIIVDKTMHVEISHPDSEVGTDYSSHADIVAAFDASSLAVVREGQEEDILAPLKLADGDVRVLEIKLDFSATLALLEAQYARLRAIALAFIAVGLGVMVLVLLFGVRRAILVPLSLISEAMERVGSGDLESKATVPGKDEIAAMAGHFNTMVLGLRERFELSRYVSKSTVGVALARAGKANDDGSRHGQVERKVLCVLFTDVRGFTAYSERSDPARVIDVINRLLGMQEEIVDACSGYVDKFVGDEMMAIFERPVDAVAAAVAIRERNQKMKAEIDGLAVGLGIHVGPLVEGDIGSPRMMNHTVIGDTVNLAARLQAAAGPGQVIVSDAVARDRGVAATFTLTPLPAIMVKGKEAPVTIHEVGGRRTA